MNLHIFSTFSFLPRRLSLSFEPVCCFLFTLLLRHAMLAVLYTHVLSLSLSAVSLAVLISEIYKRKLCTHIEACAWRGWIENFLLSPNFFLFSLSLTHVRHTYFMLLTQIFILSWAFLAFRECCEKFTLSSERKVIKKICNL